MLTARLAFVIGLLVSALLAVPMTACAQSHRLIVPPLAKLVHTRFENEAANGTAAAATTVVLGAAVGALVGLATCN